MLRGLETLSTHADRHDCKKSNSPEDRAKNLWATKTRKKRTVRCCTTWRSISISGGMLPENQRTDYCELTTAEFNKFGNAVQEQTEKLDCTICKFGLSHLIDKRSCKNSNRRFVYKHKKYKRNKSSNPEGVS